MKKLYILALLLMYSITYSQDRIDPTSIIDDFTPQSIFNFDADSEHFIKSWNWSSESRKLDSALYMNFNHIGRIPSENDLVPYFYLNGQNWIFASIQVAGGDKSVSITQAQAMSFEAFVTKHFALSV